MLGVFNILAVFLFIVAALGNEVNTTDGPVKGTTETTNNGNTYYAYYSIPYSKPPLGTKRFLASEPIEPWTEIYDASTEKTNICYQLYSENDIQSEDCLYLSVFTPQDPTTPNKNYSVVVNIHGGGFYTGSGRITAGVSPKYLIDENVIVVLVNYRLGAFGFLSTGDDVIPGNAGLSDQILALKWVQKNIAAFGGDPNRVTISGQSAGAKSVGYLILSPLAKGLFSAGIMESGTELCPGGYQRNHTEIAFKVASFIDSEFNSTSTKKLLKLLQNADAKTLNKAATAFAHWASEQPNHYERYQNIQGYYFTPAIDSASSNPILPIKQYEAMAEGSFNQVPIFLGVCSEEGLMDGTFKNTSYLRAYDENPSLLNPQDMNISGKTAWAEVGSLIKQKYSPSSSFVKNPLGVLQYYTDHQYVRGSIKHAELHSAFANVYYYQFSYTGQLGGGNHGYPGSGNVSHVGEMNYLYSGAVLKDYPENDQLISKRLVKLWSNFIKFKNPTPKPEKLLQNITWPKVTADKFQYVNIGDYENTDFLVVENKLKADKMAFWDGVYHKYGNRPFDTY